jgi:hypothetical protein
MMSARLLADLVEDGFSPRVAAVLAYSGLIRSALDLQSEAWMDHRETQGLEGRLNALPGFGRKAMAEMHAFRFRHGLMPGCRPSAADGKLERSKEQP